VHLDYSIEILALEVSIRPCPAKSREEVVFRPPVFAGRNTGCDDLLREDIKRRGGLRRAIKVAAPDRTNERRGFD
jgi:hypothetical protein